MAPGTCPSSALVTAGTLTQPAPRDSPGCSWTGIRALSGWPRRDSTDSSPSVTAWAGARAETTAPVRAKAFRARLRKLGADGRPARLTGWRLVFLSMFKRLFCHRR